MCNNMWKSLKEQMKKSLEWYNGTDTDIFECTNDLTKSNSTDANSSNKAENFAKAKDADANLPTEPQKIVENKSTLNKSVAYGVLFNASANFIPKFTEEVEENKWPHWNEERKVNSSGPTWNSERKVEIESHKWNIKGNTF